jgi:hypothetical protein
MKPNWLKHNEQEWSIDIAEFTHSDPMSMPDGLSLPAPHEWEAIKDGEGEITKWILRRNGKIFTIFND